MPKQKSKKTSPAQKSLNKALRQIKQCNNIELGLVNVKKTILPTSIWYVLSNLQEIPDFNVYINSNAFPDEYSKIKKSPEWIFKDIKRDANWLAACVHHHKDELQNFEILRKQFEENILTSNLEAAKEKLQEIEDTFGKSLWLIENKLLLLNTQDIKERRKFANSIIKNDAVGYFTAYITYFYTQRLEPNQTPGKLDSIINKVCADIECRDDARAYIKFHIFPHDKIEHDQIGVILNSAQNAPIIDKYMLLCHFIRSVYSWDQYSSFRAVLTPIIQQLSVWSINSSIQNINRFYLGHEASFQTPEDLTNIIDAFDDYTLGQYGESKIKLENIFQKNPAYSELYEIQAKNFYHLEQPLSNTEDPSSLREQIVDLMQKILSDISSYDMVMEKIAQIIMIHSSHNWPLQLLSFWGRQGRKQWIETKSAYTAQAALASRPFNPWQHQTFHSATLSDTFLEYIKAQHPTSPTIDLQNIFYLPLTNFLEKLEKLKLPDNRRQKYLALKYIQEDKLIEAIEIFVGLLKDSTKDTDYYDTLRYLVNCYSLSGKVLDGAKLVVESYLKSPSACVFLPIPELLETINMQPDNKMHEHLSWPILNEIYYRHFRLASEELRSDSYQDFMEHHNLDKPSEINDNSFNLPELIFFLRYVCVTQVMEETITFNGTEELYQERIRICRMLGVLDSSNSQEYISELADLTKQIELAKLSRQVEQSKIYVDIEGIQSKLEQSYKEKFQQYLLLVNNPELDSWSPNFMNKILEQLQKAKDEKIATFTFPPNEAEYILGNLITDIQHKFISSTDHGLVFYLSTRIRHGTLAAQLRSPLESHNLLTTKSTKVNQYKDNEYWEQRLNNLPSENRKVFQSLIKDFTKNVDSWIDEIKEQWIQVKLSQTDTGYFDYSNKQKIYRLVSRKLDTKNTTYDEFLDIIFESLWQVTEESLDHIRDELKTKFEPAIIELLNSLRANIDDKIIDQHGYGFNSIITQTITDIQNSVDKVIEWFRISKQTDTPDTPISMALDLGVTSINSYYPQEILEPDITIPENEDLIIKGKWLSHFIDIFLILLNNVKLHSGFPDRAPDMEICISSKNDKIIMSFSNELSESIEHKGLNKKLSKKLKNIEKSDNDISKEGGSGLPKLFKILRIDLKCNPQITSKVAKDKITITITVDKKEVLA